MKKKAIKNLAKLSIWEFAVFKLCLVSFTLMLAVISPPLGEISFLLDCYSKPRNFLLP
jgi:hypothetical protein